MIKKGVKTSELWVVVLFIISQGMQSVGVDPATTNAQVVELAKQLHAQVGGATGSTLWLAVAYVVGRQLLKWRELGLKNDDRG